MISGNGTPKKIATNAAAAIPTMTRFLSARLPIRTTASSTIASTAAFRPKKRLDDPDPAEGGVDDGERHDREDARQDEERAGDEPALGAVQKPADVDGELLRLGAGQEHAVVERVQEPASPIQRFSSTRMRCITAICPAGPPKESGDPRPGAHRLGEGDAVLARHLLLVGDGASPDLACADHRRLLRKWE